MGSSALHKTWVGIKNGKNKVDVGVSGQMLTADFLVEVAKGNVPGHSIINKFGHNPTVATGGSDIWGGGGTYGFYPATAQAMEIVSTDVDDDGDPEDTGAWSVIIYGLDGSDEPINETKTLNGTTVVPLSNTYKTVYRAVVLTAGSTGTNEGAISIRISGGGTVAAFIGIDDGQTQMTHFTIPANTTGYFIKGYVALGNDDKNGVGGTFQWQIRLANGGDGAWAVKGQVPLVNIGSSHWQYEYGAPAGPIPASSDLRIRVTVADEIIDGIGGYDLLLVEDGY